MSNIDDREFIPVGLAALSYKENRDGAPTLIEDGIEKSIDEVADSLVEQIVASYNQANQGAKIQLLTINGLTHLNEGNLNNKVQDMFPSNREPVFGVSSGGWQFLASSMMYSRANAEKVREKLGHAIAKRLQPLKVDWRYNQTEPQIKPATDVFLHTDPSFEEPADRRYRYSDEILKKGGFNVSFSKVSNKPLPDFEAWKQQQAKEAAAKAAEEAQSQTPQPSVESLRSTIQRYLENAAPIIGAIAIAGGIAAGAATPKFETSGLMRDNSAWSKTDDKNDTAFQEAEDSKNETDEKKVNANSAPESDKKSEDSYPRNRIPPSVNLTPEEMNYVSSLQEDDVIKDEWETTETRFLLNRLNLIGVSNEGRSFIQFLFSRVKGPWDQNMGYNIVFVEEYRDQIEITLTNNEKIVYKFSR